MASSGNRKVGPFGRFLSRKSYGSGTDSGFVKVVATATPGTNLHTHASGRTSQFQRVRIDAWVTQSTDRLLTLEWGGVTDPDDHIVVGLIADDGPVTVAYFLLARGKSVAAFAAAANEVNCYVEVTDEE